MKKLIYLSLILIFNLGFSQTKKLEGNWVSDENEMITFNFEYDKESFLNSKTDSDVFYLKVLSDTLSFQSRYYTSANNYEKMVTDRYDFKILNLSDSILTLKPISEFSINFFGDDKPIIFKNQKFIRDETFEFEKLIFHTTTCNGTCPVIHLEILKNGRFKLNGTYFEKMSYNSIDHKRSGSFTGKLKETDLKKLNDLIVKSRITTFEDSKDNMLCCDGAIKTLIVYHHGKRNYFKAMFEPRLFLD